MSITTLRSEFRIRTGDLNILDADIDNYINRGIKTLDSLTEYSHALAKHFVLKPIATQAVGLSSNCRAIREVYLIDATTGRAIVGKITQKQMRDLYPDAINGTNGKPIYYAIDEVRSYPDAFDETVAANVPYAKYINTQIINWTARGIEFNHPDLSATVTENWWTLQWHEAVMLAAMYHMEITYRNSEGANDYLLGIKNIVNGIDKDNADEESYNATQMLG